jgi:hypothetical protein
MFNIGMIVGLLKALPAASIALPEFKKIYDQIVLTFDSKADQKTLQDAYDVALEDAADAHADLDDIVKRNSSDGLG